MLPARHHVTEALIFMMDGSLDAWRYWQCRILTYTS